jgi:eukaryotic-like serine/threonine-protein kinase
MPGMNSDNTLPQDMPERRKSRQRSLRSSQPPTQVPGYEPERFLGLGAFGEVWVAVEKNTGRRVAIKFYAHRGGLDWSLLSREVEKLSFLFADRHVVQLLGVGWDADPPYYIMEYLEQGSLADWLNSGSLTVTQAVDLFRDVAIGLVHAHGKGVLHCDLKPGNILLDQDHKPRLADFGQSRLSHEQTPALGTLFYMAPEQANMTAAPDVRWDVYALGALLYCMLTGGPPHRTEEEIHQVEQASGLKERLALYRKLVRKGPPPTAHRAVRGVDRALAEIVDRCLAPNPNDRFPNVQAVLDALNTRDLRRARLPTLVLGTIGPILVLLVVSLFAWRGFGLMIQQTDRELTLKALETDQFVAENVSLVVSAGVKDRFSALEQFARSKQLQDEFVRTAKDPQVVGLLDKLRDSSLAGDKLEDVLKEFRDNPQRKRLQAALEAAITPGWEPSNDKVNSWFLNDASGVQLARVPETSDRPGFRHTIGKYYGWRTYFHGGPKDREATWQPGPDDHVDSTRLSAAYQSEATRLWNVAVSTPIQNGESPDTFLGVGGLTVAVGQLVEFPSTERQTQSVVLVERPSQGNPGHVLDHPLFTQMQDADGRLPDAFVQLLIFPEDLPDQDTHGPTRDYHDPVAKKLNANNSPLLARMSDVKVDGEDTGWTVIVQESYEESIGTTLRVLRSRLITYGLAALAMVGLVVAGLWGVALRLLSHEAPTRQLIVGEVNMETPTSVTTPGPEVEGD